MWYVEFTKQAVKDVRKLEAAGLDKKAKGLVEVVRKNPFANSPTYEVLRGNFDGAYSRRISRQHRFVYQAIQEPCEEGGRSYDGAVKIVRMWTCYENAR